MALSWPLHVLEALDLASFGKATAHDIHTRPRSPISWLAKDEDCQQLFYILTSSISKSVAFSTQ